MDKRVTIEFSEVDQRFCTEPIMTLNTGDRIRHDLLDVFEHLNCYSGYKTLATFGQTIFSIVFILVLFILFLVILIVGLKSPPDPYQNSNNSPISNLTNTTQNSSRLLLFEKLVQNQLFSTKTLKTNIVEDYNLKSHFSETSLNDRLLAQNDTSTSSSSSLFPYHLAVLLYFVTILFLISIIFFVVIESKKALIYSKLCVFENNALLALHKRCSNKIHIEPNHEKLKLLCMPFFFAYNFRFHIERSLNDDEHSVLTGNSNGVLIDRQYENFKHDDSISRSVGEDDEKYGNIVVKLNQQLNKNN